MTMPRPVTAHRMGATLGATGAGDVGMLRTHAGTVYDLTPGPGRRSSATELAPRPSGPARERSASGPTSVLAAGLAHRRLSLRRSLVRARVRPPRRSASAPRPPSA
jgi:hypothetical protein